MDYLDTSIVVAALVPESHSPAVRAWLGAQPEHHLCIRGWVVTEFASAISLKLRAGSLAMDQRADVLAHWHVLRTRNFVTVEVDAAHFESAAKFADRHDLGLRAGDALHLAVASAGGHRMITLDKGMAAAALALGIPAFMP